MKFYVSGSLITIVVFLFANELSAQNNQTGGKNNDNLSAKNFYMRSLNTMMDSMDQQSSILSPDMDFLKQMIVHHKGAFEMAKYEIVHGKNPGMIQLAKSILYEQSSEINMMNLWLKTSLPKSAIPENYIAAMSAH
ncbi:MAG: DUF305 domain-containing protein [Chitinophagaceae bacterium]